ncbi:MAG: hypothetical protein C4519_15835 [Desulfobacteraceae bacterium]|nr:MAG: hypothetical protein C4519_15835 [Desulfobacteraceae bacterium]
MDGSGYIGSLTAVNASVKTFTVFSLMVRVDAAKTAFSGGAGFDNLAEGQKFEISGYFDGRQIVATRLERQDDLDDEFELRGTVADYDGATISLTLQNGVNAGPFSVTPAAGLLIPDTPAGLLVEAKLRQQSGDLILVGLEAEDEEETADGARMSIRGMLSDDSRDGLLINGVPFFINDQTAYEPASLQAGLMAGLQIKAEGYMQGGVLVAQMLVIADGDIRIAARIIEVDQSGGKNGTLTVDAGDARSLVVRTDNSSQFADGSTADLDGDATFDLAELSMVDFVEIRAFQNDAAELVATHIKRQDSEQDIRLEAPLESYTSDVSVTLLGMPFMVGSNTLYELNDVATDALNFFGALNIGDMVRIMGVEPNGTVGKMSLQAVSTGPGAGPVPDTTPDSGPATGLTGINVSFKLDPRLTRTHYLGDRWVSPPLYTRIQEPGRPLTVEVRTQGLAGRTPVAINPEWIAEIPGIISVTPDRGDQVLITVLSVGRTGLNVATQGVSKSLFINVRPHLETMLVEISQ